jgi:hypothetical protein
MLSLKDYRDHQQDRGNLPAQSIHVHILMPRIARCTENDFSLLRSKIRELPPVHRASLGALSRHLLHLASHSDNNSMTMDTLVDMFIKTKNTSSASRTRQLYSYETNLRTLRVKETRISKGKAHIDKALYSPSSASRTRQLRKENYRTCVYKSFHKW